MTKVEEGKEAVEEVAEVEAVVREVAKESQLEWQRYAGMRILSD